MCVRRRTVSHPATLTVLSDLYGLDVVTVLFRNGLL